MEPKIEQFVAVTGASVEAARSLLEACGGNLDLAIDMHMEGKQGSSSGLGDVAGKSYEEIHGVRAPIPQTTGVLIGEEPPPGRIMRSRRLPPTVFDPFQDYSKMGSGQSSKLKSLSELFKPPFDIMFQGSFQELRRAGQARKKWLLVNLQDSKEFASQVLNRDVWSNETIKTIVSQHFLFWQIHRITDDGVKFKQLYHTTTFPYVAILDPRTGEKMAGWESLTVSKLIADLLEFLQANTFDEAENQQNDGGIVDLPEDLQLEAAIRASLQQTELHPRGRCTEPVAVDSDDFFSISSGEEEVDDGRDVSEMEEDEIQEIEVDSKACKDEGHLNANPTSVPSAVQSLTSDNFTCDNIKVVTGKNHETLTRKRRSSCQEYEGDDAPPLRKVLRSSVGESHTEGLHTNAHSGKEKGAVSNVRKGKQRASSGAPAVLDVEERLATGQVQKEDVSQLVIRLPDGTRIQKAFLCSSPLQVLFTFLKQKGIDSQQHDVITNFPRRSLLEINPSLTFKEAKLYPRVTVFIQSEEYI